MSQPAVILLVKFKSRLGFDEVMDVIHQRMDDFRALKGLRQKYYLQDTTTQEFAGLYLWDSEDDFTAYRESELRKTIASAYETEGDPRIEVFKVIDALRD